MNRCSNKTLFIKTDAQLDLARHIYLDIFFVGYNLLIPGGYVATVNVITVLQVLSIFHVADLLGLLDFSVCLCSCVIPKAEDLDS